MERAFYTLKWRDGDSATGSPPALLLLDQTLLPGELAYVECGDVETVATNIERLAVRGAPAIGVTAAYGVAVGAALARSEAPDACRVAIRQNIDRLASTRPTAVNLFWALDRQRRVLDDSADLTNQALYERLLATAHSICDQDRQLCESIGRHGAALLKDGDAIITHCNAGSLATAGSGTALAVMYAAQEQGLTLRVFADETRPLLQGSRLTAWELMQSGIDVTVICDNMAATVMRREQIACVVVGSDRIVANGDVANKIGTYGLAVIAKEHGVPFYVAAPTSTVDLSLASGDQIPIEERRPEEIVAGFGARTAPEGVRVYNPAFDVTPHTMVAAIITEHGVATAPFEPVLRDWVAASAGPSHE